MAIMRSGMPGGGYVWHGMDMGDEEKRQKMGVGGCVMPEWVVAGKEVDVRFEFVMGEMGLQEGGALRVAWRWPFDWARPREMVVECAAAQVEAVFEMQGDLNPWHHHIELRVVGGELRQGDRVLLRCEEWGAPTFITRAARFLLLMKNAGDGDWLRLVDPQVYDVMAAAAMGLVALAEAEAVVGEEVGLRVYGEDCWGNPTLLKEIPVLEDVEVVSQKLLSHFPVYEYRVRFARAGVYRVPVSSGVHAAESNPLRVYAEKPARRLHWGDMHAGQTEIGCGAGSLQDHFVYARDVAGLQFATQQANDHYIDRETWQHVREVSHAHDKTGRFVVYLGCEWSPFTEDGGDRNVFYFGDEKRLRRSDRFFTERDPDPEPDLRRAPEFLAAMRNEDVLLGLHVGGRPTNLDFHEPIIEPLFEIHSTHGTSEWFVFDALRRGYKVGVTGGTDGVMGRPGACRPGRRVTRNVRNGLTAVRAEELSRAGLWSAFKGRHCYGTSGARILLDVEVDGRGMGEEFATDAGPEIRVCVEGTAAIERVDVLCGVDVVHCWQVAVLDERRLRVLWSGAEAEGTAGAQRVFWRGVLCASEGQIAEILPIALQSPLDNLVQVDEQCVHFDAATAGNAMGFSFLSAAAGELSFASGSVVFSCTVQDVLQNELEVAAGGASKRVRVGRAPREDGAKSVELKWRDERPLKNERAYWVRVVQVDQEQAWSSPIYVRPL